MSSYSPQPTIVPGVGRYLGKGNYEPLDAEHAAAVEAGANPSLGRNGRVRYHCTYTAHDSSGPGGPGDVFALDLLVEEMRHNSRDNTSALCPGYVHTGSEFNPMTRATLPVMEAVDLPLARLVPGAFDHRRVILAATRARTLTDNAARRVLHTHDMSAVAALSAGALKALTVEEVALYLDLLAQNRSHPSARPAVDKLLASLPHRELGEALLRAEAGTPAALEQIAGSRATYRKADAVRRAHLAWRQVNAAWVPLYAQVSAGKRVSAAAFDHVARVVIEADAVIANAGIEAQFRPALAQLVTQAKKSGTPALSIALLEVVVPAETAAPNTAAERAQMMAAILAVAALRSQPHDRARRAQVDTTLPALLAGSAWSQAMGARLAQAVPQN